MNVRTITRPEFDGLLPHHRALESLLAEQVEWFANTRGTLLGTIAKGEGVAGWNYVILKRDKNGEFHVRKVMGDFFSLKAARVDLLLSMAEALKSDGARVGDPSREPALPWGDSAVAYPSVFVNSHGEGDRLSPCG